VRPLAYAGKDGEEIDFLQLSRKHILETNAENKHISIFGGKITDCINIGEEICEQARELGIELRKPKNRWYGEPSASDRRVFDQRATSLGMDELMATDTGESYAERLWRRYGNDAITILSIIEGDRESIEPVIEGKGLRRCEVEYLARREMIINLDDLLRRRSKLEQLMRKQDLKNSKGLMKTCEILFGDQAQQKFDEYFSK
jgi:glycerol-3-phosphate dehydrogenase